MNPILALSMIPIVISSIVLVYQIRRHRRIARILKDARKALDAMNMDGISHRDFMARSERVEEILEHARREINR